MVTSSIVAGLQLLLHRYNKGFRLLFDIVNCILGFWEVGIPPCSRLGCRRNSIRIISLGKIIKCTILERISDLNGASVLPELVMVLEFKRTSPNLRQINHQDASTRIFWNENELPHFLHRGWWLLDGLNGIPSVSLCKISTSNLVLLERTRFPT